MYPELERAAQLATQYLQKVDDCRVDDALEPEKLRDRLTKKLTTEGIPSQQVIEELFDDAGAGLLNTSSGRFFGWVIGGALPVAIAAEWLTAAWDQNAGASAVAPSAAIVEEVAGQWLKDILRLPQSASFGFVTGCQMAHFTALAAARYRVLRNKGWEVEVQGLSGSPPIRVLVGEHHETILRALRQLGIGTNAVVQVAKKDDGTIDVDALKSELAKVTAAPTIVSLAAGDLNRGAFDDFDAACDVAHDYGAWVHVDGAFGLWVAASERFRHLVNGVDKADSWATDAHKWLNVTHDSGLVFVADQDAHRSSMTIPAAYIPAANKVETPLRDQYEWGPEWSRRARGFAVYATLRALGRRGVAEIVERCCAHASDLVRQLGQLSRVEVVATPIINQGLVRFLSPSGDHDTHTQRVIESINATGEAWFGPTRYDDKTVMRISVCNYRTTEHDIERAVNAVKTALDRLN
ncbi:MAG: aminotransferase class V-fold PLP-dependent enzyme [Arenicellales bacterium]|nr:aminotransferase class V-fold PLP-dependent enzyme [Arenicellales bacterium]